MIIKIGKWVVIVLGTLGYSMLLDTPYYLLGSLAALAAGACLSNLANYHFPQTGKTLDWLIPSLVAAIFLAILFLIQSLYIPTATVHLAISIIVVGIFTSMAQITRYINRSIL